MKSVAGGTRIEINLSRPWQKEIVVNSETCPFCTGEGHVLEELEGGEWLLLQNRFTPYPFHRMVIPRECWPVHKLRILGGVYALETALFCIKWTVRANGPEKLFVTAHIGPLAGQNVGHLHYHLVDYSLGDRALSSVPDAMKKFFKTRRELIVLEDGSFLVGVGGTKAGQCFILPKTNKSVFETPSEILGQLVRLYNRRFVSTQGLPPDFSVTLQFQSGMFRYGIYTPILNHWGGAEQMALYEPGCPTTLPWPHEVTAEYLKS